MTSSHFASSSVWEALVEHAPIPMGVIAWEGDDARYLSVNAAGAARLGRSVDEVRGRSARALGMPDEVLEAWRRCFGDALRAGVPLRGEWSARDAQGREHVYVSSVVPLAAHPDGPPRFGYATLDVTARQQAATDLAEVDGERVLGRLTAGVVEALAPPVRHLASRIELAADDVASTAAAHPDLELEDAAAGLAEASREARRLESHLRELGALVRPGSAEPHAVDLSRCLDVALRLVDAELKRCCRPVVERVPVPAVRADEGRVTQVLMRVLLETARVLTPDARTHPVPMRLWTHVRRDRVEVCIAHGAAPRSEPADYTPCRALLTAYGGNLTAEQLPDGAARVCVQLPRA